MKNTSNHRILVSRFDKKPTFVRETGFFKDQSDISDYTKLIRNRSKTFADAMNKSVKNGGDQITKKLIKHRFIIE